MGEIFKFFGMPIFFNLDHDTNLMHLSLTLAKASSQQALAALGVFAEGWAPLSMAFSNCLSVQLSPQSTGQPSVAYCSSVFAAGCFKML